MSRLSWNHLLTNEYATVARHNSRTLVTDYYTLWDADALAKLMKPVPSTDFEHYIVEGRKFTVNEDGPNRTDAVKLSSLFDSLAAEFAEAPKAALTGWSIDGFRIVVTADGRAVRVNGRVADTIDGRMLLRATDIPGKTIGVYIAVPSDSEETVWRFVGAVQPLCDDRYYAPVLEAIAARAVDEMRRWEESRAAA